VADKAEKDKSFYILSFKGKLLMIAMSLLTPVLLLEFAGMLLMPSIPYNAFPRLSPNEIEDDQLLWRHRTNYPDINDDGPINSYGFRGEEFTLEKQPGTLRILSLGESTTYGDGLDWQKTYSYLLENTLCEEGRHVQVINGGVRAWSTYQSTVFLSQQIDVIKPDVVLFYHEINDFLPTTFRGISFRGAGMNDVEVAQSMKRKAWIRWLTRKSAFLSGIRMIRARSEMALMRDLKEENTNLDILHELRLPYQFIPDTRPGEKKPWMSNENRLVRLPDELREIYLNALVDLVSTHHVSLILIHPAYPQSKRHECILTRIANENHIPLLDFEDVIYRDCQVNGTRKSDYFLYGDPFHPNEMGHTLLGRELAALLQDNL
jgi:lysophospholipase L1-like esterase